MKARYPGKCALCGGEVRVGDEISKAGRGWAHRWSCPRAAVPAGDTGDWEAAEAERERERDNAEYEKGKADVERWRAERAAYGNELADAWAAEDEFNRFWKYGEDY